MHIDSSGLTTRQQLFVQEYLVDLNATQAAIRAGYSQANADKIGSQLLGKTRVAGAVRSAMAERSQRTQVTADRVLEALAVIGFSDLWHYQLTDGGRGIELADDAPESAIRALARIKRKQRTIARKDDQPIVVIETEVTLWDRVAALEKLARHLGMFEPGDAPADGVTIRVVHE